MLADRKAWIDLPLNTQLEVYQKQDQNILIGHKLIRLTSLHLLLQSLALKEWIKQMFLPIAQKKVEMVMLQLDW
jgi:hypothetical protein